LDRIYIKLQEIYKSAGRPEYRLPFVIIGGFTIPLVMAFYGWIAEKLLPLPVLILSIILIGVTELLGFLPLTSFVVDAFGIYSASAMTALIVTRCLMGTFLPLAMDPLIKKFGYGWAFTMLCAAGLALAPIPPLLFRYGHKWRQHSAYTKGD
jgi:hypothetical protein